MNNNNVWYIVAYCLEVFIVIGSNAWLKSLGNEFLVTNPPQERILVSKFAWVVEVSWLDIGDGAWWASFMFLCRLLCFLDCVSFVVWSGFQMDYLVCLFARGILAVEIHDFDRIVILRLFLRRISFPDVVNDSINAWGWSGLAGAGGCCRGRWWIPSGILP